MERTHSRTLTIETGVLCNNRCVFCYQKGLRSIRGFAQVVSGEEVRARIRWGAQAGYDELSLTGGEPTVRPDFLDLVRYAREQGMRRVAVTTNGSRLSRPDFFAAAVEAGLTSMGVSVHGASPEEHDAIAGRPGAFAQALKAIRNAVATHGSSRMVRVNTFTVVSRLNRDRLVRLADILAALGVRLMVMQPVILSKSNFEEASAVALDLPELIAAVRSVALRGMERAFKVKLFNMPPCLFRDVLGGVEIDEYERVTWKERDAAPAATEPGYVRLDACSECVLAKRCPGLHVTLLPQEDLAAHFEECIEAFRAKRVSGLWLAGTELLTPNTLGRVVRKARLAGFDEVRWATGGAHRDGRRAVEAALDAGVAEVALVHHATDAKSGDRILSQAGNDRYLTRVAADLAAVGMGRGARVGLLVTPRQAALEFLNSGVLDMLAEASMVLRVRAPWREGGPAWELGTVARFLAEVARLERRPASCVFDIPSPTPLEAWVQLPLAALVAFGAARFDVLSAVLPTPLLDSANSPVNWSSPCLGHGRSDIRDEGVRPLRSRAVRARPITAEVLMAARTTCGPGPGP